MESVTRILHDTDADRSLLQGATVGVVGFGNQGAAQARCLRDDGLDVVVFLPPHSASRAPVADEGFAVGNGADLARCRVVAILAPDTAHGAILEELVAPHAAPGTLLVFAHGFALREGARARADLDVVIVGPLGPGDLLRARYLEGRGLAGLLAVVQDAAGAARARALSYASRLRMTRAGVMETTLEEEVVSDLFAEQAVLVGGAVELMRAAWENLVQAGISPEIAYYSCVHELEQIMGLISAHGPAGMRAKISPTARYGGLTRGPRIIGDAARRALRSILEEVQSGQFAQEWRQERTQGEPTLRDRMAREAAHPMEEAGRNVRRGLGGGAGT